MPNENKNIKLALNEAIPAKTRIRIISVWVIVVVFILFGDTWLGDPISPPTAVTAFLILLFTIIRASFGVVKEADVLAYKLGEPYGTLILTLSIVAIEVILIVSIMSGPGENPTIGKDSIFAVMMIIMNLVIGLCILLGGLKFGEQEYNTQGTMSYLGMIILTGGIGLILPNYIEGAGDGIFTDIQAVVLSLLISILYGFFLFLQMKGYRHLYIQPRKGFMEIPFKERLLQSKSIQIDRTKSPLNKIDIWICSAVLISMILPIVLLSNSMAVVVDYGIKTAGLPPLLGGVLIAVIVFTPESITAVKAALKNEFQRAVNLCHGAFVSTAGLTIPAVLMIGLITGKTVILGMTKTESLFFFITLLLSVMNFAGKRTTPMAGIMHLVLFVVFVLLILYP